MKKGLNFILCLVIVLGLTACGNSGANSPSGGATGGTDAAATEPIVWTFPNVLADDHPLNITARKAVEQIAAATNGGFVIEVYSNGAMGQNADLAEGVAYGTFDMTEANVGVISEYSELLETLQLPYLIEDVSNTDCAKAIFLESNCLDVIKEQLEENNMLWAATWTQGYRHLTTTKTPVHTPADLKGLKIRTMESKYHMLHFNTLGANAIPMAFSEVFTALQQGAIDGEENPYATLCQAGMGEVQGYVIETAHIYDVVPVMISKTSFDALPEEYQTILLDTLSGLTEEMWALQTEVDGKYRQQLIDGGKTQIISLSTEERQAFKDAAEPVYVAFAEDKGQAGADLVAAFHEAQVPYLK